MMKRIGNLIICLWFVVVAGVGVALLSIWAIDLAEDMLK